MEGGGGGNIPLPPVASQIPQGLPAKPESSPAVNFAPEKSALGNERHPQQTVGLPYRRTLFMKSELHEGRDLRSQQESVFVF